MKKKLLSALICLAMLAPCTAFGTEAAEPADIPDADLAAEAAVDETAMPESTPAIEDLVVAFNNKGKLTTLDRIDENAYNGFLYSLKDDAGSQDVAEMDENILSLEEGRYVEPVVENEIYSADSLETIEEVADPEKIDVIEPNYISHLDLWTKEGSYNKKNTKNYDLIDVDLLWDYGITASSVKVAVLDSGTAGLKGGKVKHQDLNYKKIHRAPTYAWKNDYSNYRYKASYGNDDHGHGTFVAGEIAARKGNKKGVVGLAPGVDIISVKVANKDGSLDDADIISGLYQAKTMGAQVVNMSFSNPNQSSLVEAAVNNLASSGIILVAAAGNNGTTAYSYPASYNNVLSVGAVDETGKRTEYSQYNNKVDCTAPGNYYGLSHKKKNKYRYMQGTSMAAPVVTAYAAIIKSVRPSYTISNVRSILQTTSIDKGASGKDNEYGYGIVNFRNMYQKISGTTLYPKAGSDIAKMIPTYTARNYVYNGSAKRPAFSLSYLTLNRDYTVEYSNNVDIGTAKITVTGTGNYTGKIVKTFKIVPKKTSFTGISSGKGWMKLSWAAQTDHTTGYQLLCYYTGPNGSKERVKRVNVASNQTTSKTVKKLKRNKIYFVWVRTYTKVGKKKYFSEVSDNYHIVFVNKSGGTYIYQ
ncbi:MAG: S8 family serine peptidase [Bacillota bacterium]|nr:S8 family serine peptidase [Bacillota bacterium]